MTGTEAAGTTERRPVPVKVWLPVGLALALVAGLVAWLASAHPARSVGTAGSARIADGRPAPGFDLSRLGGGQRVDLAGLRGRPLVLNFFASWCTGCQAELGAFAAASNGVHGDVRFVGIDTGETSTAHASAILRAAGDSYPVGVDVDGRVATAYVVPTIPTTVFVTASGTIAGVHVGAETVAGLRSWISRLSSG